MNRHFAIDHPIFHYSGLATFSMLIAHSLSGVERNMQTELTHNIDLWRCSRVRFHKSKYTEIFKLRSFFFIFFLFRIHMRFVSCSCEQRNKHHINEYIYSARRAKHQPAFSLIVRLLFFCASPKSVCVCLCVLSRCDHIPCS